MGRPGRMIGATAVALVLALAACGGDDGNSTIEADADTPTTTEATDTTATDPTATDDTIPTATSLVNVPDDLPDGRYFGFITTLVAGDDGVTGQFDLAELLTGQAAADAGAETDFFIKNDNEKLRPIRLAEDAIVLDVDYDDCCEAKATTAAAFVAARDADDEDRTPVAITVSAGEIVDLEEIYFP